MSDPVDELIQELKQVRRERDELRARVKELEGALRGIRDAISHSYVHREDCECPTCRARAALGADSSERQPG